MHKIETTYYQQGSGAWYGCKIIVVRRMYKLTRYLLIKKNKFLDLFPPTFFVTLVSIFSIVHAILYHCTSLGIWHFSSSIFDVFIFLQPAATKKAAPKDSKASKAQQMATKNVQKAAPRVGGKR